MRANIRPVPRDMARDQRLAEPADSEGGQRDDSAIVRDQAAVMRDGVAEQRDDSARGGETWTPMRATSPRLPATATVWGATKRQLCEMAQAPTVTTPRSCGTGQRSSETGQRTGVAPGRDVHAASWRLGEQLPQIESTPARIAGSRAQIVGSPAETVVLPGRTASTADRIAAPPGTTGKRP